MTDIVERLRAQIRPHMFDELVAAGLIGEAADEIERLIAKGEAVSTMAESYGQALEVMGREVERLRKAGYGGLHYDLAEAQRQEIERLRERVAKLQAQCGYTESINMLEIERLTAALTGIAVMDVYTRPGEQQASEVMRDCAKAALRMKP